jgi:hypothetical protein
LIDECTLRGEDLDALVEAVGHIDAVSGVDRDAMRNYELRGSGSRLAPRAEHMAMRIKSVYAGISVAVRHIEVAGRRASNACWEVEWGSRSLNRLWP